MRRFQFIFSLVSVLLFSFGFSVIGFSSSFKFTNDPGNQDSVFRRQLLYNGREWRNTNATVKGNPFLFPLTKGSVTINDQTFENYLLFYDIYMDELLILSDQNIIIQLNKELVGGFTINYNGLVNRFINLRHDTTDQVSGYVNELYNGKSRVFVKYKKEILDKAVDGIYEGYIQSNRIFVCKDGFPYLIRNRKQLLDLMKDKKQKIIAFIRSHKLAISWKYPGHFVPVAEYYDSLSPNNENH